jgi:hypothetical protein
MTTCLRCTDYALARSRGYKTLMSSNSDLVEDQARIGVKVAIYRSTIHHPLHSTPHTLHSTSHTTRLEHTETRGSKNTETRCQKPYHPHSAPRPLPIPRKREARLPAAVVGVVVEVEGTQLREVQDREEGIICSIQRGLVSIS